MQFRLSTLGIVVAWFAVAFGIGKAGGFLPCVMFVGGSGLIVPAFIRNVWIRVGVAFLMTGVAVDLFLGAFELAFREYSTAPTYTFFLGALPKSILSGLFAAAVSSGLRWLVIAIRQDFAIRPGMVETPTSRER